MGRSRSPEQDPARPASARAVLSTAIEAVEVAEDGDEGAARIAVAEATGAFAAAHGPDLTAADVLAAEEAAEGEVSEEELATVAGGVTRKCYCLAIGAAKGCGCFIYGRGKNEEKNQMGTTRPGNESCIIQGMNYNIM